MRHIYDKLKNKIDRKMLLQSERHLFAQGQILSRLNRNINNIKNIQQLEFKIFSQWGDDGIIDWLSDNLDFSHQTFIEFGVEDYRESNTRFLMMNKNWSGLIFDGSTEHIKNIQKSEYYWQYDLTAKCAFIDKDNINTLINEWLDRNHIDREIGILHIDIDGNDYWIWEAINCIEPIVVIMEYNSLFGDERAITVPYRADFYRTKAHYSNIYYGSSLLALEMLADKKGYDLIGSNLAGNNAYFVRRDKMLKILPKLTTKQCYQLIKAREPRNESGELTFDIPSALQLIKGKPVFNVFTQQLEVF